MASVYVSVKSKLQRPPPPPANTRAFDFFETNCSNSPLSEPKYRSNAPHYLHTMPPSRGDLKTFPIIRYVGALKAESATVCNRQYSFYSNLFRNCFIIKKTIKHTCSWQILIRIVKRNLNNLVLKY